MHRFGTGEYCVKRALLLRANYFFSRELRDLRGRASRSVRRRRRKPRTSRDLEQGKKLKNRYRIYNVLIMASISLQTKLTEIIGENASASSSKRAPQVGRRFFFLVLDLDMDPREAQSEYRSKNEAEKLFSSMKSDIGIRPIRTRTDDAVNGVLLIGFLAQAMTSVTRILSEPTSSTAT